MQTPISLSTLKLHNERLDELIKELEGHFTFQTPSPKEDLPTIMYRAGQASVIDYIKQRLEE